MDRSSCQEEIGVGILLISSRGEDTSLTIRLDFGASKNETEYEALILRLRVVQNMGINLVTLYSDSQLVAQQISRKFEAKNEKMIKYTQIFNQIQKAFSNIIIVHITQTENVRADQLAKMEVLYPKPYVQTSKK